LSDWWLDGDGPIFPSPTFRREPRLRSMIRRASGVVVVVGGPVGIGKSTALRAIRDDVAAIGGLCRLLTIADVPGRTPFGAIASLLDGVTDGDLVGTAFRSLSGAGDAHSNTASPVLIIDDAPLLDDASAAIIGQLGVSGLVRLVLSVRHGVALPGPIRALLSEREHAWITLEPFDMHQIESLAEATLGGAFDPHSLRDVVAASQGNPLFVRELLLGAIDTDAVVQVGGVWRFVGGVVLSPLLRNIVATRLQALRGAQREALELLAIGGALELGLVGMLVSAADLERLEDASLIAMSPDGTVDLIHPLHREYLLGHLGALSVRRRFAALAAASADLYGTPAAQLGAGPLTHRGVRSVLWCVRGDLEPGADALVAAASVAQRAFDTALSAELAALAFASNNSLEAALIASWGYGATGAHDSAAAVLRSALESSTDPWFEAACRLRLAEELWWWEHNLDGALALLDPTAMVDGEHTDLLVAQRGVFALLNGDIDQARKLCAPLVDHRTLWVRFVAAVAMVHVLSYDDQANDAFDLATRAYQEAVAAPDHLIGDPSIHVVNQMVALIHAGRLDEARDAGELLNELANGQPDPLSKAWCSLMSGFALLMSGEPAQASRRFAESEASWVKCRVEGIQRWARAGRLLAAAAADSSSTTSVTVSSSSASSNDDDGLDNLTATGFHLYDHLAELALTWRAMSKSDERVAAEHARRAIAAASAPVHRALVAHDLARLGLVELARGLLGSQVAPRSDMTAARWAFVAGVVNDDPGELERAGALFVGCAAHLFAAEAFALASRRHRSRGSRGAADRLEGLAGRSLQRCEDAATPPLRGRSSVGPLSPREHQIAQLAADGFTNREIAARLVIGERTVETHLSRVYMKLGVAGRRALAGVTPGRNR